MKEYELKVRLTFILGVLGTQTGDPDIYRSFIGSKSPDATTIEEEVEALGVEEVVEKGKTFFPRVEVENEKGEIESKPFIYDYQLRGFFKSACGSLNKVKGTLSSGVKAYKKLVDTRIFVKERKNILNLNGEITECQRPLRCSTMQGERVSIAISEQAPAGSTVEFTILTLNEEDLDLVREWLDYGKYNGLLQWRNSKMGAFTWEEIKQ